jgi:hypothetical protein
MSLFPSGLRSEEQQATLSHLAACPNCHLIASVDHVNAALMWPTAVAALFRWAGLLFLCMPACVVVSGMKRGRV